MAERENTEPIEIQPPKEVLDEHWRDLRVGDRIRIVKMPWFANVRGFTFHPETRLVYEKLIARRRSLRVYKVDKDGLPLVRCQFRMENGLWEYHWLAVNDDSWVRVKSRST